MINSKYLKNQYKAPEGSYKPLIIAGVLCIAFWVLVATTAHSAQINGIVEPFWTNNQIVNAIYLAEGGDKAQYPYGIRSVNCGTRLQCKRCCETTIQNNRIRFAKYGYKRFKTYLSFLQSRYCPTGSRTATQAELRINGNWLKNVTYFLNHPRKA